MASIPPETPGTTQPAQPDAPPTELPSPTPDIDVPAPGVDPGIGQPQPLDSAASSDVGIRNPGDADDMGSTAGMAASTGGLAGTSR